MTCLVDSLNSKDAPQDIRIAFAAALGPVLGEKAITQPDFKFTKHDFEPIVIREQLSQNKESVTKRKEAGMISDKIPAKTQNSLAR